MAYPTVEVLAPHWLRERLEPADYDRLPFPESPATICNSGQLAFRDAKVCDAVKRKQGVIAACSTASSMVGVFLATIGVNTTQRVVGLAMNAFTDVYVLQHHWHMPLLANAAAKLCNLYYARFADSVDVRTAARDQQIEWGYVLVEGATAADARAGLLARMNGTNYALLANVVTRAATTTVPEQREVDVRLVGKIFDIGIDSVRVLLGVEERGMAALHTPHAT